MPKVDWWTVAVVILLVMFIIPWVQGIVSSR